MNISNKTVLITGGGSGIGLETAKQLIQKGNRVILAGRSLPKLKAAQTTLPDVVTIQCDITSDLDVENLVHRIKTEFSELSVLINNAGKAFVYTHGEAAQATDKARQEMDVNYFAMINLTEKLLPLLRSQPEAAIVNVSSIVAFTPMTLIPTYSDSKAAVHSYTLALRHTLQKDTAIRVYELMPPTVNTEFAKEIGGETHGMPAVDVASALVDGLERDTYEIYVGQTAGFRDAFFASASDAFARMNQG